MANSWFGSSGATPHTMTKTNTPAARLLLMSQVRSSKLVLGLVVDMLRIPLEELCLQIKSLSPGYIRPFLMRDEDLKQFRQWGSRTPGHPKNFETLGVEVTTGLLLFTKYRYVGVVNVEGITDVHEPRPQHTQSVSLKSSPSSPPSSTSSSTRSRRHQSHCLPLHTTSLVLSLLPVGAVKVITFLSTIIVLPHTCAFSVSVSISISASIEDFDAETLAGECDLSNCSHYRHRFHPPSSPEALVDAALMPPQYVLKGIGGGGGARYGALMHELRALGVRPDFVTSEAWNRYREYWVSANIKAMYEKASYNRKSEKSSLGIGPSKHTRGLRSFWTYEDVLALDRDENDESTLNDVFLHVHTKDHNGMTFIDNISKRFRVKLVRRREEHTRARPDRSIDEKYYDAARECSKGHVYGSLSKRKRRYEDLGAKPFGKAHGLRSKHFLGTTTTTLAASTSGASSAVLDGSSSFTTIAA
ncbi:hypothetical protein Syun_007079 [Stephania yunnanensis]|uniref:Transketolase N-terminal domain-containing protein n=1 Tax=Stephania yunnanensis TaxID=152371 RepID=A0AAP0KXW6_9MAGN